MKLKRKNVKFKDFVEAAQKPTGQPLRTHIFRTRASLQFEIEDEEGAVTPLAYDGIANLSVQDGQALVKAMSVEASGGKVVSEGDGIATSILFKLERPLGMTSSSDGKVAVNELEFMATSFADIEDAVCSDTPMSQTLAIIGRCAGAPETNLKRPLPMMLTDQISLEDGIAIMEDVLPAFLAGLED